MSLSKISPKAMTREQVIRLSVAQKMEYLDLLQVEHAKLNLIGEDLRDLLAPHNEVGIITIIGATGVGKTTLSRKFIHTLASCYTEPQEATPSTTPYVFIKAPANGDRSLSWRTVYEMALLQSGEPLLGRKFEVEEVDGKVFVKPSRYKTLAALRQSLENMLRERKVQVLAIDEAFHLLRFGNYSAVMDTLKSLADETGVKIILVGTYDLFDLATAYGQVSRRKEVLHFQRYHRDVASDKKEFRRIVQVIQQRWPCEQIPQFDAIADELMQATLGCIGLLKSLLLKALAAQLKNKGVWEPAFLAKAAKSLTLIDTIRAEIDQGETKLRGGTYGESMFHGEILKIVAEKMSSPAHA